MSSPNGRPRATAIAPGTADGPVLALAEPISFWGGVDPASGRIIDSRHPDHGADLSGRVVLMPTTRGSCSGSGVVLDLALSGRAPAALIFREREDTATLGALVAAELFGVALPVLRVEDTAYAALSSARRCRIDEDRLLADGIAIPVERMSEARLELTEEEQRLLDGEQGEAAALAMRILVAMARHQGARALVSVTRAHIDGCIYAGPANLLFAERMRELGARVGVPTTTNAISVDRLNWQRQAVPEAFGVPAAALADAYVAMGAEATFTCAPYLHDAPAAGEFVGWSESNAVIYANSVLGARTAKHPDFLDLCIAITGRAPLAGPFLPEGRQAALEIAVDVPAHAGPEAWPLIGYLAGRLAGERVPLLTGLASLAHSADAMKALCAAFGVTASAPMLRIEGITPDEVTPAPPTETVAITREDLREGWHRLNEGSEAVDLVAIGSPHASIAECRALAARLSGRTRHRAVKGIVTVGRRTLREIENDGTGALLAAAGIEIVADLCWCSITRPVFPEAARTVLTDSGKYAHYGPGLSGCAVRLGSLDDCLLALTTGRAPPRCPDWLA